MYKNMKIRIGSRGSNLALWQANYVKKLDKKDIKQFMTSIPLRQIFLATKNCFNYENFIRYLQ